MKISKMVMDTSMPDLRSLPIPQSLASISQELITTLKQVVLTACCQTHSSLARNTHDPVREVCLSDSMCM